MARRKRQPDLPVLHPPVKSTPQMARAFSVLTSTGGLSTNSSVRYPSVEVVHYQSRRFPWGLAFGLVVIVFMMCAFYYGARAR